MPPIISTIRLRSSSVPGEAPAALADGEIAINTADKKLFFKNSAGAIASFSMGVADTAAALSGKSDTAHTHSAATSATAGFMAAADKAKLDGIATGATAYVHPSGDGSLHVPATGTTNNGKVLKAGATAGSIAWGSVAWSELTNLPAAISTVAGLTPGADQIPYYSGTAAAALTAFTAIGRSLVGSAALILLVGLSVAMADDASPREVYLASLGDQPTALGTGRRDLVAIARRHIGKRAGDLGLPRSLWCADFANLVRREAGLRPVPSRLARDQARLGRRLASPQIGAIAIVSRRGGSLAGHTGIIWGFDEHHVVLISGNAAGRRVAEETISRDRLIAIIDPS